MIEILLKILLALFALFGLYAFAHVICQLCFQNDRIKTMILVDSDSVSEEIDFYLEEAKNARFIFGGKQICAIIMEKYASESLLHTLKQKGISWEIVKSRGE